MAPRPHNSGHWTLDACDVSQFELQVRTLAGLPLNAPRQHSPAIMLNLLGDLWFPDGDAQPVEPRWADVLALPGTHLHLYGKTEARPRPQDGASHHHGQQHRHACAARPLRLPRCWACRSPF